MRAPYIGLGVLQLRWRLTTGCDISLSHISAPPISLDGTASAA